MRNNPVLLIFLGVLGCARLQQAAAPVSPHSTEPQVAEAGTIAPSLSGCLTNMAHARLPPSQQVESNPIKPVETTTPLTGAVR
jgi:hypothetical protein